MDFMNVSKIRSGVEMMTQSRTVGREQPNTWDRRSNRRPARTTDGRRLCWLPRFAAWNEGASAVHNVEQHTSVTQATEIRRNTGDSRSIASVRVKRNCGNITLLLVESEALLPLHHFRCSFRAQ